MADNYDTLRKSDDDDDTESIGALKRRAPQETPAPGEVDDTDNPIGFQLEAMDLSDIDLEVVILPPQADEFTCFSCFLVQHRSQIDHEGRLGPICLDCAS